MARLSINIADTIIYSPQDREVFLPLDGDAAYPLTSRGVEMSGLSRLFSPYEVRRNARDFHTVIYTLQGHAGFETSDGDGVLEDGDLWMVPAHSVFRYWAKGPWRIMWFHIGAAHGLGKVGRIQAEKWRALYADHLLQAVEHYISEAMPADAVSRALASAYAEIIAGLLDKEMRTGDRKSQRIEQRLNEMWEQVHADLRHPWTVDALARLAHFSPPHLHRLTRQMTGLSPMRKVTELRLQHAAQLLANTDHTLQEIATRVGYESPFALSRIFKKHRGVSPAQYRKG